MIKLERMEKNRQKMDGKKNKLKNEWKIRLEKPDEKNQTGKIPIQRPDGKNLTEKQEVHRA